MESAFCLRKPFLVLNRGIGLLPKEFLLRLNREMGLLPTDFFEAARRRRAGILFFDKSGRGGMHAPSLPRERGQIVINSYEISRYRDIEILRIP